MPTVGRVRRLRVLILALVGVATASFAASLQDDVGYLVTHRQPPGETIQGRFLADVLPMSQVLPSSTPGWALTWDAATHQLVPSESPAGPIFTERATTLGAGEFLLHATYQDLNFQRVNGHRLKTTRVTTWLDGEAPSRTSYAGYVFFGIDRLELYQRMSVFGLTYGITDAVDVALDLPTIHTRLNGAGGIETSSNSGPLLTSTQDSDTGVGDLLLRGKWQAATVAGAALALELGLRLPSGDPENFRGTGTVGLIPTAIASRRFGPAAVHAEIGFDVDAAHVDSTRARYRVGGTVQALSWLGFSAELVGSSGVVPWVDTVDASYLGVEHFRVPRTDIIDGVYAFNLNLFGNVTGFAGVDVPITSDGIRPNLVPMAGASVGF